MRKTDRFTNLAKLAYFPSHDQKLPDKWNILRNFGRKELSLDAQLKLEWIIFYYTVSSKNAKATATHFMLDLSREDRRRVDISTGSIYRLGKGTHSIMGVD